MKHYVKRSWQFLKEDSWQSWLVSLILTFLFIKFIFFPSVAWIFGTPLPLVVVESCSMYHEQSFDGWWDQNGLWYEYMGITRSAFEGYPFLNGLNKGDIVLVSGRSPPKQGDVIIFNSDYTHPLIHRLVTNDPLGTKGDHNSGQLAKEVEIPEDAILGTAVARFPGLGWLKLIFFEGFRSSEERGFCR